MIDLRNVGKVYDGANRVVALDGINLHVDAGSICKLSVCPGRKIPLIRCCINMLERPTSGQVLSTARTSPS